MEATALDPKVHYKYGGIATNAEYRKAVTLALRKIAANSEEATSAIRQFMQFRNKRGLFDSQQAQIGSQTFSAGM